MALSEPLLKQEQNACCLLNPVQQWQGYAVKNCQYI